MDGINFSDILITRETITTCGEWCFEQIPHLFIQKYYTSLILLALSALSIGVIIVVLGKPHIAYRSRDLLIAIAWFSFLLVVGYILHFLWVTN